MTIFAVKQSESLSVMSNPLRPYGLYSPWNSPGQNPGIHSLSLLQGIFPTQRLNPGLLHCRRILYQLSHYLWREIYKWTERNWPSKSESIHIFSPKNEMDHLRILAVREKLEEREDGEFYWSRIGMQCCFLPLHRHWCAKWKMCPTTSLEIYAENSRGILSIWGIGTRGYKST